MPKVDGHTSTPMLSSDGGEGGSVPITWHRAYEPISSTARIGAGSSACLELSNTFASHSTAR